MLRYDVVLVRGFVRDVDERYRDLQVEGELRRYAVGFFSDNDVEVVSRVCRAIARGRNMLVGSATGRDERPFHEWRDTATVDSMFSRAWVFEGRKPVVEIRWIDFNAFGGPAPYHDRQVLEMFVEASDCEQLHASLRECLFTFGAPLTEIDGEVRERISEAERGRRLVHELDRNAWRIQLALVGLVLVCVLVARSIGY